MSLDVYLYGPEEETQCTCECGNLHTRRSGVELYSSNITHNLGAMAEAAGIYKALWRPDESRIETAGYLIPILEEGLAKLKADPEKFKAFNAKNGWGMYEHFVPFVSQYLDACRAHPDARVRVCR